MSCSNEERFLREFNCLTLEAVQDIWEYCVSRAFHKYPYLTTVNRGINEVNNHKRALHIQAMLPYQLRRYDCYRDKEGATHPLYGTDHSIALAMFLAHPIMEKYEHFTHRFMKLWLNCHTLISQEDFSSSSFANLCVEAHD